MENRFRQNLEFLLNERGISQAALAAALEMPRQTVGNWIAGAATPTSYRAQKVADYFGVNVGDLVYGDLTLLDIKKKAAARQKETRGAQILAETSVAYDAKSTPPDALRRLLAYAVLLNGGDLDMLADMAERLAGKDGKR